ncbi:MAG TPA: hypothetical protein VHM91_16955, partial [Verrucomicrobiales bacterium]|nr:hypothetical protein [Verrucomicrobiales bacterium]
MITDSFRLKENTPRVSIALRGVLWTLLASGTTCSHADTIAIGAFDGGAYGGWEATGTAFAKGTPSPAMQKKLEIENAGPASVISSEVEGDQPTGTLTSPEFEIVRPYIAFRIGGGNYETHTCLNLLIDGKVVRSAT